MGKTSLPPGFRFHPMDDELVMYYLKKKVMGKKMPFEVISELDIYKFVPQDLPDKSCLKSRDREWYFFCPRARKYASGGRMNRTTESGYWKTTGKDRQVVYENRTVGQIRTLIFHQGRAPKGDRTDWVMHEYRLEDKVLVDRGIVQDAFVLCKIFQKSGPGPKNGAQYGAPFNEEEWNSEDEADHIESLPFSSIDVPAMVLNDNQSNSILRDTVGPEDMPSGFPSNSGPSQSLPSADMVLPSVPDGDIFELPDDDELMSMLDMFEDSNENDENEVDKPSHAQNVDDALPNVDGALPVEGNDIFKDLGDLGKLAEMNEDGFNFSSSHKGNHSLDQWLPADSFLELRDLDHPLKITVEGSGSGFVPPGGVCMDCDCCNNSEHFDHPFNDFGVMHHASASIPNPPVLADRSYGFENQMDVFSKKCVGENAKRGYGGYESASYITEQSEPDSGHVAQTHKRGEQAGKSPMWNELFVLETYDPQLDQLHITVKDKGFTSNKFIGECRLPVNMFLHGNLVDEWYTLSNGSYRAGEINLRVQFVNTAPGVVVAAPVVYAAAYPAPQGYPPQQYPQQAPYPPPQQYQQYPSQQYPPPNYAYGAPPSPPVVMAPAPVVYAAPPPTVVYEGNDRYYDDDRRRRGGGGGADVAMGAAAGALGGLILGDVLFD